MHPLEKFHFCPVCGSSHFVENDFKSKRCKDCGFVYYFNAAAAVVAIITNERGELLVAKRAFEPAKGTLDLIGGFADMGETGEEAMKREIKEETDIDVQTEDLEYLFTCPNTYLYSGLIVHTCDMFFLVKLPSTVHFEPHDDVASCKWVKFEDVNPKDFGLKSISEGVEKWLSSINKSH